MPKQKLIATRAFTYATRRLVAEEPFEAVTRDARVLKAIGKARDDYDAPVKEALAQTPVPVVSPPVPSAPASAPAPFVSVHEETHHESDPLDALRGEAAALGVHVDRRWGEARLAQEIDAALERSTEKEAPETPAAEPHEAVAMTTGSASALMPNPWQRDKE